MAVPKKKKSKSRSAMGRAHCRLTPPNLIRCSQCQEKMQMHHVCRACGYYRGRQVIESKA